jgi:hypothetical protein
MWSAIRYRPAQAALLAALSALIVGSAAFAPLYERSLEQALLRDGLSRMSVGSTAIELSAVRPQSGRLEAEQVREVFPSSLADAYHAGSDLWWGAVGVPGRLGVSPVVMYAAQDTCAGLEITTGRCPSAAFEVLASAAEAALQGWALGATLDAREVRPTVPEVPPFAAPVVVVGTYVQTDDPTHWVGITLGGKAGTATADLVATPLMDALVTDAATFVHNQAVSPEPTSVGWLQCHLVVTYLLDRDALTLESLPGVGPALGAATTKGLSAPNAVRVRSSLGELADGVSEGQRQARVIVPLLMTQLALLAVIVLGLVAGSAVEQRRQEIALARLRGGGDRGAARLVLGELGTAVTVGAPIGLVLAWLANAGARSLWLVRGIPAELPVLTVPAALLGLVLAWVCIAAVTRPTVSEPVATLLRRVPPRTRARLVGVTDAAIFSLAVAAVVAVASGNLSGPLALATPALLALAVGMVMANVLTPAAAVLGGWFMARGRLAGALTALQGARRPAVRRIVTIMTVATALAVFASDAVVVGGRNRQGRAREETGASLVLMTDSLDPKVVSSVLAAVDPAGRASTPVVWVRQAAPDAIVTMAVDPARFADVADLGEDRERFDLSPLGRVSEQPPSVRGTRMSVTISSTHLTASPREGSNAPPSTVSADGPVNVYVQLATVDGGRPNVTMGAIPLTTTDPVVLSALVSCPTGCAIVGFGIDQAVGDTRIVRGDLVVGEVRGNTGPAATIGAPDAWLPTGSVGGLADRYPYAVTHTVGASTSVGAYLLDDGSRVGVTSRLQGASLPALVVGHLPVGTTSDTFQGAGLDGLGVNFGSVGSLPYAPGGTTNTAIVSLPALLLRADALSTAGRLDVFVADPSLEKPLRDALAAKGIGVRAVNRESELRDRYDGSASAWGLQLALVVGVLAVVLAALVLVLVAATAWRGRARDYAALRMAGMPTSTLRRASIAEQAVVVLVAGLLGAACGVGAAYLAMPIVPLFTTASPFYVADLRPDLPAVAVTAAGSLLALLIVAAIVGLRLVQRADLSRLQDQQ